MKELDANIQGKIMKYCAYQDRSISEVIDKLYKLEVWKEEHDKYINYLIDNLFLDEIRFTTSFVRGKFRIKHWGKQKN
jgi:regulatory protein